MKMSAREQDNLQANLPTLRFPLVVVAAAAAAAAVDLLIAAALSAGYLPL
jgi:hypothetical protein